jgi:uncharacterized protein (TIGR03083 family)
MTDVGALYGEGRRRIAELVRGAGERVETTVPACPEWTVRELVSHLSGVCADIINGRLDGVATNPWTKAQVDGRRDWPVDKILEEWDDFGAQCEVICQHFGGAEVQWLSDLTTHEHDIRGALGEPGARDCEAVRVGFTWLAGSLGEIGKERGLPTLRLRALEGDEVVAGDGAPHVTVTGTRFDLFRMMTGRRSIEQIDELEWDGDRGGYFEGEWGPFHAAESRIVE